MVNKEAIEVKFVPDSKAIDDLRNSQAQSGIAAADANSKAANVEEDKKEKEKTNKQIGQVQSALNSAADITSGILSETFNVIQQLYERLKKSSPLLETIETLFNLAMTLLFMPLGNALGEVILPSVIDLVDNILSMWETFDAQFNQGDLAGMLTTIMTTGVQYIGTFVENVGKTLENQGGLLGSIGQVLNVLGTFIQGGMVTLLNAILKGVEFVITHVKELISLLVAFKAASFAADMVKMNLMIQQMQITAASGLNPAGVAALVPSMAVGYAAIAGVAAVAGGATYAGLSSMGLAEGGYVPATEGGQYIPLGDRGEGEYVIPESKMDKMGGGQTIVNNFYGYTQAELIQVVKDTLRNEILDSKYTAGGL